MAVLLSLLFLPGMAWGQTDERGYPTDALPDAINGTLLRGLDDQSLVFQEKFGSDMVYDPRSSVMGIRNASSIESTAEGLEITDESGADQPATFISFKTQPNLYPCTMDIDLKVDIRPNGYLRFVGAHANGRMNHVFVYPDKITVPMGDSQRFFTQDQILSLRLVFDEEGRGRIVSRNNEELNLGITPNADLSKSSHLTLILKDAKVTLMEVSLYSQMP